MAQINLKLAESQLAHTDYLAGRLDKSRTAYIREAIQEYNARTERGLLASRLRQVSERVRAQSLEVAREMEAAETALPDDEA